MPLYLRPTALAATALVLAGCLGATAPTGLSLDPLHAVGTNGWLMPPAGPFDGSGVQPINGTALVHTFLATHSGYVDVSLSLPDGRDISIHWTDFREQPNASWQTQGIASNVVEHGASGHGNKMEPQVDLLSGGWGSAQLLVDGQALLDPVSGATNWSAHYMVTKEGIMDPTSHAVYKSDKTTPFDPAAPGDSYVFPGRTELHVGFWTDGAFKNGLFQTGQSLNATNLTDSVTGAMYAKSWPLSIPSTKSKLAIVATVTGAGQLTFTLKDPSGAPVASAQATQVQPATLSTPSSGLKVGTYTLEVTGAGLQAAYRAGVTVETPQPQWIHVVFENVKLGD
ncbi:MAG: carboxypeptidase-like regulatory domain-containing protein [Thermoplasmatota archaeon]